MTGCDIVAGHMPVDAARTVAGRAARRCARAAGSSE